MKAAIIAEAYGTQYGYEWAAVVLVRGEDDRLYVAKDSGCSCYGPWDLAPANAEICASWIKGVADFMAETQKGDGYFSREDGEQFRNRVMEVRPRPTDHGGYEKLVLEGATVIEVKA